MQKQNKKLFNRKYRFIAVLLLIFVVSAMILILCNQKETPDPASEAFIRRQVAAELNKDPNDLTDEDFAKIAEFSFAEKRHAVNPEDKYILIITYKIIEIADIKLFEKFLNLQVLMLNNIHFPEKNIPKWMKLLSKLGILDINFRFNIDLSPLENLTYLEELYLQGASVKNIKPLSNITNLKQLNLNDTRVCDIEPLKGLKNLEELYLNNTKVSDLKP